MQEDHQEPSKGINTLTLWLVGLTLSNLILSGILIHVLTEIH